MNHGGGYVYLAISTQHPDRVRVGQSEDIVEEARDADWKIAYARRVAFPQTIERIMRDHLSRLGGGCGAGEYAAPYGHAQLVLDSLAREFGTA